MAILTVQSIRFCDEYENLFEFDEQENVHFVPFRPKAAGYTGEIFLKAKCKVEYGTGSQIQTRFNLELLNRSDFNFTIGVDDTIDYVRQVTNDGTVYLKLELHNRKAVDKCYWAEMLLYSKDSASNSSWRQRRAYIKAI